MGRLSARSGDLPYSAWREFAWRTLNDPSSLTRGGQFGGGKVQSPGFNLDRPTRTRWVRVLPEPGLAGGILVDALDVLKRAEELGGVERKQAMMQIINFARQRGCDYATGGGKIGGFNIRYGSLKYAVMDVNSEGTLFLHIKPHPGKAIPEEYRLKANEFIQSLDGISIKNGPIHHYGQVESAVEKVPSESIAQFLDFIIQSIHELYY